MDDSRAFATDNNVDRDFPAADEPRMDAPPVINLDERRMHVRAYNFWVSLLNGRAFPAITDLDARAIDAFGPNSVLLDFTRDNDNPTVAFLGSALREEGGLSRQIETLADVPSRSLLSRLTDHYMQIIANRAPIGFEAEYRNQRDNETLYRGILMPFSSNGETIDFVYGVINWKEVAEPAVAEDIMAAVAPLLSEAPDAPPAPPPTVWAESPAYGDAEALDDMYGEAVAPGDDASLYDRLAAARIVAEECDAADQRSRAALYRALGLAYDFALAAAADTATYSEILEDAGLKPQARAPMTPVVKLVFGIGYDKTRLSEYATVLTHAARLGIAKGGLPEHLDRQAGGLKALVKAERALRRPASAADRAQAARTRLAALPAIATVHLDGGKENAINSDYISLIGRKLADGGIAIVSLSAADDGALIRAIRTLEN